MSKKGGRGVVHVHKLSSSHNSEIISVGYFSGLGREESLVHIIHACTLSITTWQVVGDDIGTNNDEVP